jgi:hypothetical protein
VGDHRYEFLAQAEGANVPVMAVRLSPFSFYGRPYDKPLLQILHTCKTCQIRSEVRR